MLVGFARRPDCFEGVPEGGRDGSDLEAAGSLTYTFEVAEQKQCEVLLMAQVEDHPLRVEVERA